MQSPNGQPLDFNHIENEFFKRNRSNEAAFGLMRQVVEALQKRVAELEAENAKLRPAAEAPQLPPVP